MFWEQAPLELYFTETRQKWDQEELMTNECVLRRNIIIGTLGHFISGTVRDSDKFLPD